MSEGIATQVIDQMQWVKIHIRLAALEQKGSRLSHRFGFPNRGTVVCDVYFTDDDANPLTELSQDDRLEIYQGWMNIGKHIIEQGLHAAELPNTFAWSTLLRFVLHVNYGMGSSVVHEADAQFQWPRLD